MEDKNVLLVQLFEDSPFLISNLELQVSEQALTSYFAIDNYSDEASIQHARSFLKENQPCIVALWESPNANWQRIQPILNELLKKKTDFLITNSDNIRIKKLASVLEVQITSGANDFVQAIRSR